MSESGVMCFFSPSSSLGDKWLPCFCSQLCTRGAARLGNLVDNTLRPHCPCESRASIHSLILQDTLSYLPGHVQFFSLLGALPLLSNNSTLFDITPLPWWAGVWNPCSPNSKSLLGPGKGKHISHRELKTQ